MIKMLFAANLRDALLSVTPFSNETSTITAWTDAWVQYMSRASAGVPINALALPGAPAAAMRAALMGISSPNMGAGTLQAGITAFWNAIVAAPATYFPGAVTITPPPALASIPANIRRIFETNTRGSLPQPTALMNLASALHASNQGGTATFAVPPQVPIV